MKEQVDDTITKFGVVKRALKAKTNPRTIKLSKPRASGGDDDDEEERPGVNPTALKGKASQRLIQLSKPRVITEKFKILL